VEKFSGPLAQPIADTVARFATAPGVSGIFLVVFTDDFKKITVANTVPRELGPEVLRAACDQVEQQKRRILLPG
jgi:hypothetical protein